MDSTYRFATLQVLVKSSVSIEKSNLAQEITNWFNDLPSKLQHTFFLKTYNNNGRFPIDLNDIPKELSLEIVSIYLYIDCMKYNEELIERLNSKLVVQSFLYKLYNDSLNNTLDEELPAAFHTLLPSKEFEGLWESLIFESDIRAKLLNYVKTSLLFAERKVNPTIVTWNKVILLHGPPGTGKTTLLKALAHQCAIRHNSHYSQAQLIEINSHSLFSKWFSESGKLVMKLFDGIREFAEDSKNLLFVLIDEVESLAYDRQLCPNSDPTDAIRVVNALLTQIDSIRRYPNVIILASSNVTELMDNAFVDRVDIKEFIGLPSPDAAFRIYQNCIEELVSCEIIDSEPNESLFATKKLRLKLMDISKKSNGFSGRTLRKLPFLTMLYTNTKIPKLTISNYLDFLEKAVDRQCLSNEKFNQLKNN
ncbi:hypothetical protein RDWZM_006971 [Blomia tropicalis]|uniref:AAA+ ATPase domain-containing protein n=1 Tax=Blomia tropicalis TaxID=40697 RepID=A0A9Q0M937_BLOTA|nr:hypothetical protein RDWZM_006971 [Blomia tropicalis]